MSMIMKEAKNNILIGTPAYGNMVHTDYMHTILNLNKVGVEYALATLGNESLITRARNKIFSIFIYEKKFDKLLFLDADISINPQDIKRLSDYMDEYDLGIVGAPVRLKDLTRQVFNYTLKNNGKVINNTLYEVDKLGTAVMLINRKIAEKIVEKISEDDIYYHDPDFSRGTSLSDQMKQYDVFKAQVVNHEYLSEDYYFVKLVQDIGGKVFVDLSIKTLHNGNVPL